MYLFNWNYIRRQQSCQKSKIRKRESLKEKPDTANLGFGQYFTDYMLSVDYDADQGWHDMKIVPYAPFEISPAAQGLHYGQAVLKALKPINIMAKLYYSVQIKTLNVLIIL